MGNLLASLLRIAVGTALGSAALFCIATFLVRQPSLRALPYPVSERASPSRLRAHVDFLTNLRPRGADSPHNLDLAAQYIAERFGQAGGRVAVQSYAVRGRSYRNVVADFGPLEGAKLVVGAHYDAFTMTGPLPGADDNASGTAGLLELARLLGLHPPKSPVQLVAFTLEEPPFFASRQMGSAVHAESLKQAEISIRGMICLEMIGYFRGRQTWPSPLVAAMYPDRADFIAVAGGWSDRHLAEEVKAAIRGAGGVKVFSFTGPRQMQDASDQRNYWNRGWPAVMITDTAFLRNPNYHTSRDTADTLDYRRMAGVVDGLFTAVSN